MILDGTLEMRKFAIASGLVLAGAMSANAADLIVDEAPATMDTSFVNSSIYVQLVGGVALAGDNEFDYLGSYALTDDTEAGFAVAGTVGVVVLDGVSLEADVMYTKRAVNQFDGDASSLSLMANAKYTFDINETFSLYGAAGVGHISYEYGDAKYNGIGYQLIAGVGAKLTDSISAVAEYRYQNTFEHAEQEDGDYALNGPTSSVLAGLKFSF